MACTARALSRSTLLLTRRRCSVKPVYVFSRPSLVQQSRFFSPSPFIHEKNNPPLSLNATPKAKSPIPEFSVNDLSEEDKQVWNTMSAEERAEFEAEYKKFVEEYSGPDGEGEESIEVDRIISQIDREAPEPPEVEKKPVLGFWGEDEEDEFAAVEDGNEGSDDVITSMAEAELELHREMRHYARIAAWDMPLLAKHAKEFTLPPKTHILRFRYTYYMGEQHPAEHKVVMELSSKDLIPTYLTEEQRQTFLKLVGTRYNPDTDIVRMSTEKFASRAQNKRYLGDLIKSLISEAKNGDSFADVPLDLRHHKPKIRHYFPENWKLTEERKGKLVAMREQRRLAEEDRVSIVHGKEVIAHAVMNTPALSGSAQGGDEKQRVPVRIAARNTPLKQRR